MYFASAVENATQACTFFIFIFYLFSQHPSGLGLGGAKRESMEHPKESTEVCSRALSFYFCSV